MVLEFQNISRICTSNTIFRDFWMTTCTTHTAEVLDLGEDFKDVEIRDHACGKVLKDCTILLDCNQSAFSYCEVDSP